MVFAIASRSPFARSSLGPAQWRIAGVALLLHLALLMVPIARKSLPPGQSILEIEFQPMAREAPPRIQADETPAEPGRTVSENAQQAGEIPLTGPGLDAPAAVQPLRKTINAAILLEQAKRLDAPRVTAPAARLGRSLPRVSSGLKTEPILPPVDTLFKDSYLPAETEIIDQWQDRSGTRHVVMRTPAGHTLCGSLQAWDPINPLFEPVPMYHLCAGGGKRGR